MPGDVACARGRPLVTGSLTDAATLLRVRADDPEYRRLAEAEAEFWRRAHPFGLESIESLQAQGPADRYTNARYTGDRHTAWHRTIPRHGRFRRGIVLGTSSLAFEASILRDNPDLHLTFLDLSEGPLLRRMETFAARFPGRVAHQCADLNFVDLPQEAFDLIVSRASVHHVTNLEHLAHQLNRALTPDGRFFLEDWVGERRFQFSAAKRAVFEAIYNRDLARQRDRRPGLSWLDDTDLSPFCGVRSDDILGVLRTYLVEVQVRFAGSLMVPLMRARPTDGAKPPAPSLPVRVLDGIHGTACRLLGRPLPAPRVPGLARLLEDLAVAEDVLVTAGLLLPGNAFAIYSKR
jgi:SAM-dependent methyltransferase